MRGFKRRQSVRNVTFLIPYLAADVDEPLLTTLLPN